jgi:hypothetical protein
MGCGGQSEVGRMSKFQIIIRKFWIKVEKPIWSFIVNCVFWLGHLNKISAVKQEMEATKGLKIETLMNLFKWQGDVVGDWTPWVSTVIAKDLQDDCDGAAALAKWWFKEHGIEADILNLYSTKEGHAICVTKDRTKMVTNERVIDLNPATWEQDVMKYFGNKYKVII